MKDKTFFCATGPGMEMIWKFRGIVGLHSQGQRTAKGAVCTSHTFSDCPKHNLARCQINLIPQLILREKTGTETGREPKRPLTEPWWPQQGPMHLHWGFCETSLLDSFICGCLLAPGSSCTTRHYSTAPCCSWKLRVKMKKCYRPEANQRNSRVWSQRILCCDCTRPKEAVIYDEARGVSGCL